jgi:hypothetical protein
MPTVEIETVAAARTTVPRRLRPPSWIGFAAGVLAAGALGGAIGTSLASPAAPQYQHSFIAVATGDAPTVVVYYADGTSGDGGQALSQPWTPPKPVREIVVTAGRACSITVDEVLAITEGAAVNRSAVCLWSAP